MSRRRPDVSDIYFELFFSLVKFILGCCVAPLAAFTFGIGAFLVFPFYFAAFGNVKKAFKRTYWALVNDPYHRPASECSESFMIDSLKDNNSLTILRAAYYQKRKEVLCGNDCK